MAVGNNRVGQRRGGKRQMERTTKPSSAPPWAATVWTGALVQAPSKPTHMFTHSNHFEAKTGATGITVRANRILLLMWQRWHLTSDMSDAASLRPIHLTYVSILCHSFDWIDTWMYALPHCVFWWVARQSPWEFWSIFIHNVWTTRFVRFMRMNT